MFVRQDGTQGERQRLSADSVWNLSLGELEFLGTPPNGMGEEVLHDQVSISKILHHLGLSPPETAKPPPAVHEVVRVPVDEGRKIEAP